MGPSMAIRGTHAHFPTVLRDINALAFKTLAICRQENYQSEFTGKVHFSYEPNSAL